MLRSRFEEPQAHETLNDLLKSQDLQSWECGSSGDCLFNVFAKQSVGHPGHGPTMRAATHFLTGGDDYLACLKTGDQKVSVSFFHRIRSPSS
jgi:hypothetical protein